MQKLLLDGKKTLSGSITISGSKNSALPILAATILNNHTTIKNIPYVNDILTMLNLLKFIGLKYRLSKKTNLVELNSRLKKIDLIEKIFIREFNNDSIYLKIKYLGKLDTIIRQLKNQKIILKFVGEQWSIKII